MYSIYAANDRGHDGPVAKTSLRKGEAVDSSPTCVVLLFSLKNSTLKWFAVQLIEYAMLISHNFVRTIRKFQFACIYINTISHDVFIYIQIMSHSKKTAITLKEFDDSKYRRNRTKMRRERRHESWCHLFPFRLICCNSIDDSFVCMSFSIVLHCYLYYFVFVVNSQMQYEQLSNSWRESEISKQCATLKKKYSKFVRRHIKWWFIFCCE